MIGAPTAAAAPAEHPHSAEIVALFHKARRAYGAQLRLEEMAENAYDRGRADDTYLRIMKRARRCSQIADEAAREADALAYGDDLFDPEFEVRLEDALAHGA